MKPKNAFVGPLLTDLYQLTMAYAYWKNNRHNDYAVFDLFFRQNPFGGEFTVFAGLEEALKFVANYRFSDEDIEFLRDGIKKDTGISETSPLKNCDPEFFKWLSIIDCSKVKIYAIPEGTLVFPRVPLLRVEGPLAIVQLLETTLLTLINYPSLIATNAARHRIAAGNNKILLEFGLRRAQGPDGGVSAAHYSYMGGFDGTSNVLSGKLFDIPIRGTHAHSFVSSFSGLNDITDKVLKAPDGKEYNFVEMVLEFRQKLEFNNTNEGELSAFIAYAQSFPDGFLALVDTYDTLASGVPNFICVALSLAKIGYKPVGIRLDSGDLAYYSKNARNMFNLAAFSTSIDLKGLIIAASNEINEEVLLSLAREGHEIDVFGIGTHLVTCVTQPALGCVYKLVEINQNPRIKLSEEIAKVTIPAKKEAYRLYGEAGYPLLDIMIHEGSVPPKQGERILCRHPFVETKRVFVVPTEVKKLHTLVWDGELKMKFQNIRDIRQMVIDQLANMRSDHLRPMNPTPYKVSVSDELYSFIHNLWLKEAPVDEIK